MGLITSAKEELSRLIIPADAIDPLLRFGRSENHPATSTSLVMRRLQRLQRRLRLDFTLDESELGLPAEMIAFIPIDTPPLQAALELLATTHTFDEDFYTSGGQGRSLRGLSFGCISSRTVGIKDCHQTSTSIRIFIALKSIQS